MSAKQVLINFLNLKLDIELTQYTIYIKHVIKIANYNLNDIHR